MKQSKTQSQTNREIKQLNIDEIEASLNERINNINSKLSEGKEINDDDKKLVADLLEAWKKDHLKSATFGYLD